MADIYAPEFTNEEAAIAHLEQSRWPDGAICPHCGSVNATKMAGQTQAGYFQCNDCRDKFTCRTGTVLERSHIPVHKWLLAIHLMASSKKGMSAHQLHRMLGITYKSAWFLSHRIREAMIDTDAGPLGGEGKSVQADETYIGNSSKRAKGYKKGHSHKEQIVALVEPNSTILHAEMMELARPGLAAKRKKRLIQAQKQLMVYSTKDFLDIIDRMQSSYKRLCDFTRPIMQAQLGPYAKVDEPEL